MQRFQSLLAFVTIGLALAFGAPSRAQEPLEVIAFGDSLSAGYGVGPGESFPDQLQAVLGEGGESVRVVNAGVSGDTTSGGLARLDWSVPASADVVIVELGANDALRGISPQVTRTNLDAILEKLAARENTQVILAGMLAPPNMGGDYAAAFNPIFAELAEKHGVPLYPFFLEGVASIAELNQADYMHPNAQGVAVIVKGIAPMVREALDRARASAG